jgi:hypothetical protein
MFTSTGSIDHSKCCSFLWNS